jgi:ERCC4-type nuclease
MDAGDGGAAVEAAPPGRKRARHAVSAVVSAQHGGRMPSPRAPAVRVDPLRGVEAMSSADGSGDDDGDGAGDAAARDDIMSDDSSVALLDLTQDDDDGEEVACAKPLGGTRASRILEAGGGGGGGGGSAAARPVVQPLPGAPRPPLAPPRPLNASSIGGLAARAGASPRAAALAAAAVGGGAFASPAPMPAAARAAASLDAARAGAGSRAAPALSSSAAAAARPLPVPLASRGASPSVAGSASAAARPSPAPAASRGASPSVAGSASAAARPSPAPAASRGASPSAAGGLAGPPGGARAPPAPGAVLQEGPPPGFRPLESVAPLAERSRGVWEVVLLVDHREKGASCDPRAAEQRLIELGVRCAVCNLSLGDYAWVVRRTAGALTVKGALDPNTAWMLPFIIERKRADDLASSIMGQRYGEQKFRLTRCGLPNVTYIVEGKLTNQKLTPAALATAMTTTFVVDGFAVHHSESFKDTMVFLTRMHALIELEFFGGGTIAGSAVPSRGSDGAYGGYGSRSGAAAAARAGGIPAAAPPAPPAPPPAGPPWTQTLSAFALANAISHTLAASTLFGMQLRQIKGMSNTKAEAVIAVYPTPSALSDKYASIKSGRGADSQDKVRGVVCFGGREGGGGLGSHILPLHRHLSHSSAQMEKLLEHLPNDGPPDPLAPVRPRARIGPAVSTSIARLFTEHVYGAAAEAAAALKADAKQKKAEKAALNKGAAAPRRLKKKGAAPPDPPAPADPTSMSVLALKAELSLRGVSLAGLVEKRDLAESLLAARAGEH